MRQSVWQTFMGLLLLFVVALISWHSGSLAAQGLGQGKQEPKNRPVVVLDAGQGGRIQERWGWMDSWRRTST